MRRRRIPNARLYRKSNNTEARLAYLGHLLMENRHRLIVDAQATVSAKKAALIASANAGEQENKLSAPPVPGTDS